MWSSKSKRREKKRTLLSAQEAEKQRLEAATQQLATAFVEEQKKAVSEEIRLRNEVLKRNQVGIQDELRSACKALDVGAMQEALSW